MSAHTPPGAGNAAGQVSVAVSDGIAVLRFFHPKSNSLPGTLLTRLAGEISALGARRDVTVIVVRSDGTGPFCAGASFDELAQIGDAAAGAEFFSGFARGILAIGLGPFVVGPCIERKMGLAAFSAMSVDADWRDAEWCERRGLYSRVFEN